ncbi:serine/threonine protein phosphatase 1 [Verrucomicrobium sp. GAS474]|uniref:metallophosphoesterase n=1 Tax=Verrucomicrobium sp. GAS474 TaxID=1882831 RepID=UPI00087D3D88|nr:metallophosphoesterase [Verrucomicrobium sp. GAS474]SDU28995.1 serine/threonine protein phosphatase 1 [Verrucomicrobium sp. GAS474]
MKDSRSIPAVTYAVGDIHGRLDLLTALLGVIVSHRHTIKGASKLIFLGDYIDRGADSKGVVDLMRSGKLATDFDEVIILKGNHEWILWEILRNGKEAESWLYRNGGVATLKSYGLAPEERDQFPDDHLRFLNGLPLYHSDGVRLFTHAGPPNDAKIEAIPEKELLRFRGRVQDVDGRLVVHGHNYVLRKPLVTQNAINIDTAAHETDQLTCAVFLDDSREATFIATPGDETKIARREKMNALLALSAL